MEAAPWKTKAQTCATVAERSRAPSEEDAREVEVERVLLDGGPGMRERARRCGRCRVAG